MTSAKYIDEGLFNKNNNYSDIIKKYKNDIYKIDNNYYSKYVNKLKLEVDSKLKNIEGYESYSLLRKDEITIEVSVNYKEGYKLASALKKIKIGDGFYDDDCGILLYDNNIILFDNGIGYLDDNSAQTMGTCITFKFIYTKEDEKYNNIKVLDLYNIIKLNGKIDLSYEHYPIIKYTKAYVKLKIDSNKIDEIISSFKEYKIQKKFNTIYIFNPLIVKNINESYSKERYIMKSIKNLASIAENYDIKNSNKLRDDIVSEYRAVFESLDSIDESIISTKDIQFLPVYKINEGYAIDLDSLKYVVESKECTLEKAVHLIKEVNDIEEACSLYCVFPDNINEFVDIESFIKLNKSLTESGIMPAIKNFGDSLKNLFDVPTKSGKFENIRPRLLRIVNRCKTLDDVNYLRRDMRSGIVQLTTLKKNRPQIAKQIDDHIKWLKTDYAKALNDKAKEIRSNK